MPWHTPERKAEQALKLYFQTVLGYELTGVQFTTRFSNAVLTEPRVEIYCTDCEPWEMEGSPYTGNWKLTITLKIVSHYAEAVDAEAHDNIVGNLLDQLLIVDENGNESASAEINATQNEADLTVLLVDVGTRSNAVEEHSLVTEQELVLYVKPS